MVDLLTAFPVAGDGPREGSGEAKRPLKIAGQVMPGKWTLVSAPKKFGWQVQKGFFLSGATVLPTGDDLVTVKFRAEFWNDSDFYDFTKIRKALLNKGVSQVPGTGGSKTTSLSIDHPELAALGVTQVVVQQIDAAIQTEPGLWMVAIEFLQYRAAIQAPAKPDRVTPTATLPTPSALDNVDLEGAALKAQVEALQGQF